VRGPAAGGDFSTGPIPVVRDGDPVVTEDDAGPKESALAWLRFAGELVIALAAGIGVYFLATVLWEQVPQLAVFLTPLAVTGLVAGVSVWRQRLGREPVGARLLAVLVFAGALLTVAPAAGLLSGS
jgi:membrane protein YdbS with pleckstrin-like domain